MRQPAGWKRVCVVILSIYLLSCLFIFLCVWLLSYFLFIGLSLCYLLLWYELAYNFQRCRSIIRSITIFWSNGISAYDLLDYCTRNTNVCCIRLKVGLKRAKAEGAICQTRSRLPVHFAGSERRLDSERAQIAVQSHQGKERADWTTSRRSEGTFSFELICFRFDCCFDLPDYVSLIRFLNYILDETSLKMNLSLYLSWYYFN